MVDIKTVAERDRSSVLHPFTQLKEFATGKIGDPTIVTGAKGIHIKDAEGPQLY
ncbi:adenosylmethionine-8-amino-7-oxononanoate aminotransferase [Bradyrhizobium sp. USDA 4451]